MLHPYQTQQTVRWWRQSLSVVRQCLIMDLGPYPTCGTITAIVRFVSWLLCAGQYCRSGRDVCAPVNIVHRIVTSVRRSIMYIVSWLYSSLISIVHCVVTLYVRWSISYIRSWLYLYAGNIVHQVMTLFVAGQNCTSGRDFICALVSNVLQILTLFVADQYCISRRHFICRCSVLYIKSWLYLSLVNILHQVVTLFVAGQHCTSGYDFICALVNIVH